MAASDLSLAAALVRFWVRLQGVFRHYPVRHSCETSDQYVRLFAFSSILSSFHHAVTLLSITELSVVTVPVHFVSLFVVLGLNDATGEQKLNIVT